MRRMRSSLARSAHRDDPAVAVCDGARPRARDRRPSFWSALAGATLLLQAGGTIAGLAILAGPLQAETGEPAFELDHDTPEQHHSPIFELDDLVWSRFDEDGVERERITAERLVQAVDDGDQVLHAAQIALKDEQGAPVWAWQAERAVHDPRTRILTSTDTTLGWQWPSRTPAPGGAATPATITNQPGDFWTRAADDVPVEDQATLLQLQHGLLAAPPAEFIRALAGRDVTIHLMPAGGTTSTPTGTDPAAAPAPHRLSSQAMASPAPVWVLDAQRRARATGWVLDRETDQLRLLDNVRQRQFGTATRAR